MQEPAVRSTTLLLLGGTSDIALAITRRWLTEGPLEVALAARPGARRTAAAAALSRLGGRVEEIDFDAEQTSTHEEVVAFGLLGDNEPAWTEVDAARRLAEVHCTGAVTIGVALAQHVRTQGHGVLVALSSVAGERSRRSNAMAETVVEAIVARREQIWVPAAMRGVMSRLRHVPRPIFRKLPI